jgi:hypothetical protein
MFSDVVGQRVFALLPMGAVSTNHFMALALIDPGNQISFNCAYGTASTGLTPGLSHSCKQ